MAAPASELAFASTASRATAIGGIGVPRPRNRARTLRPQIASAIASSASAGTPLHGSSGSDVYTWRSRSHIPAAQTTAISTRVRARVGLIGNSPPPAWSGWPSCRWPWPSCGWPWPSCGWPWPSCGWPWPSCGWLQHGAIQPGDSRRAQRLQQVRHLALARKLSVGVGVVPGGEDERALVGAGVRQHQPGAVTHLVTVDDEVEVQRPRSPEFAADPG